MTSTRRLLGLRNFNNKGHHRENHLLGSSIQRPIMPLHASLFQWTYLFSGTGAESPDIPFSWPLQALTNSSRLSVKQEMIS